MNNVSIIIENASLTYLNAGKPTLDALTMTIHAKQWTCLLGRSGSGKTSLLRYLAGLLHEKVQWQGTLSVSTAEPLGGLCAYMAQQDLLLPWSSVFDNVCLSHRLKAQRITSDIETKALELLRKVGLLDHRDSLPQHLSGGMRQRVALARTLMQDKPLVLMDEPFSALDAVTRHKLQNLSHELLKNKTVVHITHDAAEALRLADKLYILRGRPAKAESISLPIGATPREFCAEFGEAQKRIFQVLEQDSA